jgi:hypothetical protein
LPSSKVLLAAPGQVVVRAQVLALPARLVQVVQALPVQVLRAPLARVLQAQRVPLVRQPARRLVVSALQALRLVWLLQPVQRLLPRRVAATARKLNDHPVNRKGGSDRPFLCSPVGLCFSSHRNGRSWYKQHNDH